MQVNTHKVTIRIVKTKRLTTSFYKFRGFSAFLNPGLSKYCCFHVVVFLFFVLFCFGHSYYRTSLYWAISMRTVVMPVKVIFDTCQYTTRMSSDGYWGLMLIPPQVRAPTVLMTGSWSAVRTSKMPSFLGVWIYTNTKTLFDLITIG